MDFTYYIINLQLRGYREIVRQLENENHSFSNLANSYLISNKTLHNYASKASTNQKTLLVIN